MSFATNRAGWNVGGGVMGFFNDHIGLRGEVRYLRAFDSDTVAGIDLGTLNFTRLSIGLVIRLTEGRHRRHPGSS